MVVPLEEMTRTISSRLSLLSLLVSFHIFDAVHDGQILRESEAAEL
jgi:hypothetical protein